MNTAAIVTMGPQSRRLAETAIRVAQDTGLDAGTVLEALLAGMEASGVDHGCILQKMEAPPSTHGNPENN